MGNKIQLTSPLEATNNKRHVYISSGKGGYENTIDALSKIDLSVCKGKKVLLKPNAGRIAHPGKGVTTHPEIVAAAIDVFRQNGAEVAIGESPISGVNTMDAFEESGIAEIARQKDCPLIDMDVNKPVSYLIPQGIAIDRLSICPEVFDFDLIVSIPVIKTHMHTGVTLSVKNMKGCLWRRSKVTLHMLPAIDGYSEKPIDIAISDMAQVMRPHLSIIDGSYCMEGLGPSSGKVKFCDMVLVGIDAFATDATACRLMGLNPYDIPHIRLGGLRGFGNIDEENIDVFPKDWKKLASKFELSPKDINIQFPGVEIHDSNSCSACQSTLLLFLKRYGKLLPDYFPNKEKVHIAIGKTNENVPGGTILLGNCCRNIKDSGIFVKGCPPVASEILRSITKEPYFDIEDAHSEGEKE